MTTHNENVKMRYTMKTNARRALKTRFGDVARSLAEELIYEDAIGFYIVESEVRAAVRKAEKGETKERPSQAAAPQASAATANVLKVQANPVVVAAALEALKAEEKFNSSDWPELTGKVTGKSEWKELFDMPKAAPVKEDPKAARCDFKNGARKPLKGKTAEVWAMGDKLLAENGTTPTLKEMRAAMPTYSPTTVAIQFYAWRKYNGLDA